MFYPSWPENTIAGSLRQRLLKLESHNLLISLEYFRKFRKNEHPSHFWIFLGTT